MKSSDQMAIEWEISKRTINDLCNKGKIWDAGKTLCESTDYYN